MKEKELSQEEIKALPKGEAKMLKVDSTEKEYWIEHNGHGFKFTYTDMSWKAFQQCINVANKIVKDENNESQIKFDLDKYFMSAWERMIKTNPWGQGFKKGIATMDSGFGVKLQEICPDPSGTSKKLTGEEEKNSGPASEAIEESKIPTTPASS